MRRCIERRSLLLQTCRCGSKRQLSTLILVEQREDKRKRPNIRCTDLNPPHVSSSIAAR